jgi:large conductance mechanosensitive channel
MAGPPFAISDGSFSLLRHGGLIRLASEGSLRSGAKSFHAAPIVGYHVAIDFKENCPMSIVKEFKEFALKGNVMDLAVGVIIGGAFSTIVNSVVKDLIMPVVGVATGGLDFSNKFILLGHIPDNFKGNPESYKDLQTAGVAAFGYGSFITVAINFVILAFIIFMMVKFINKLRTLEPAAPPAPPAPTPEDVLLLREIRDSLKQPRV